MAASRTALLQQCVAIAEGQSLISDIRAEATIADQATKLKLGR